MSDPIPFPIPQVPTATTVASPKIAVIGAGRWGKNLIRNFNVLGHLAAICDLNAEHLNTFSTEYPDTPLVNSVEVLYASAVDGVVIATPSHTHYELAKQALLARKHVYIEKPMATESRHAEELLVLAEQHDRILMVGHLLLYHPGVHRLKQLIAQGELGDIKFIQSDRLNFNPHRQDTSVMWDLAPHDLSMVCDLLGSPPDEVLSVHGHQTSDDGRVDVVHIELAFPGGVTGHIHNSWVHPSKQVRLMVRGTKQIAVLDDTLAEGKLQLYEREGNEEELNAAPTQTFPTYLAIEPLKLECQHFIHCIQENLTPKTAGSNGAMVVSVLEEAEAKMQTVLIEALN